MILRLICVIFVLNLIKSLNGDGMTQVFQWKQMEFNTSCTKSHRHVPQRGRRIQRHTTDTDYIPYNNVPMGVTHYKGRLFVTLPRRRPGILSTLNYIDLKVDGKRESPKLRPYPNLQINQLTNNQSTVSIVSVYRTRVDSFGRLWFVDTGMLEFPGNSTQLQAPAICIIDLTTDKLIRRVQVPESIVDVGRGMASITIDTDLSYNKTFAYIPDLLKNRLYVYSFEEDKMWSFSHNYFHFDPIGGDFNIGGQSFRWDDGIFSITLGPKKLDGSRFVFFHAMASTNEFYVNNRVLQNETNALRSYHGADFQRLRNRGENMQSTIFEYDSRTGVLFYALIQQNAVGCSKLSQRPGVGIVKQNTLAMIYPSDLTIDEDGILWVMTNSMPVFIYSQLDTNQFNFRIWKQNTTKAVENTPCGWPIN